ncbi:MAG: division/cell wall cluster transcriptional repressor MraZ [Armatimonadota bacterium]
MVSGAHAHTIDAKGRIVLPARFRVHMGEPLHITRGLHGCLWLFPDQEWKRLVDKLTGDSMFNPDILELQRFFLGNASECHPDDAGRITIPELLRQYAGIQKDIVTIGVGNRLEVWALERWDAYSQRLTDERVQELGQRINL